MINDLINAGRPFYVIATGAGAGIQDTVWHTPGVSSVLLGAEFPYHERQTDRCLGFKPNSGLHPVSYCSPEVAVDLATAAFYKALDSEHENNTSAPVGLGLTASVASTRVHRGDHRVYAATVSDAGCTLYSLIFKKGVGQTQRSVDGVTCDNVGLVALWETINERRYVTHCTRCVNCAGTGLLKTDLDNLVGLQRTQASELLESRFFERACFLSDDTRSSETETQVLFPGTFNPPTFGHANMVAECKRAYWNTLPVGSQPPRVVFSVTANPPHKPASSIPQLLRRAHALKGHDRTFVKDAPLYVHKARLHPGCSFLIGADALVSMLDPVWGVPTHDLLREFDELKTRFFVSPRLVKGVYTTLDDIDVIPESYKHMFTQLEGRWDVSSTELRER